MYEGKRIFSSAILTAFFLIGVLFALLPRGVQAAVPEGPGIDSIESNADGITLEWYKESWATGYDIYRYYLEDTEGSGKIYTVSGSPAAKYATVNCPAETGWEDRLASWTDADVVVGKIYVYYLRAFNEQTGATSESGNSAGLERFLTPTKGKLGSLEKPKVMVQNEIDGISVKWTGVSGATGYYIYRYENGKGSLYATAGSSVTSYTDKDVTPGNVYSYCVRAYSNRTGAASHDGSGGTKWLQAPSAVKASRSGGSFTLNWAECGGAAYYYVEVSESKTFSNPLSFWVTDTTRKLTGFPSGKSYYVRLRTFDEAKSDCSVWSDTVKLKISKKTMSKRGKVLKYSDRKTSLQKMWTAGPSSACIEFLNLIKENRDGSSMSFLNQNSYKEAVRYYFLLTGDGEVIPRNNASTSAHTLTFTVKKNRDNRAYATGTKGYLMYYKKAYKMLSKAGVKSGMPIYKAAMKIEAYIRRITKYKNDKTLRNHNFYSIIDKKRGVCQSYAQLFQVMCMQAGIDCRYCAGKYKGRDGHAWNRFKADGKWYYIDVTFRDSASTKSWPASRKKLKSHEAIETMKFVDAYNHYNCGISPRPLI